MLKIAICDDDTTFINHFTHVLTTKFTDAGQQIRLSAFSDGKSLLEKVEKEKQFFDVVFLDVEMPMVNGFQVAQRLRELNAAFILVFTTYIEHQSRQGYRYGAFRYVFKNNLEEEIDEAVASIITKLNGSELEFENISFKCRISGVLENLVLKKTDILFLEKEKTRRVVLRTVCSDYELMVKPLSEYAKILTPPTFVPIMRCYLLNFNHVESINAGSFVLTGGLTVPLGVKREARKASMEKYLCFLEGRI